MPAPTTYCTAPNASGRTKRRYASPAKDRHAAVKMTGGQIAGTAGRRYFTYGPCRFCRGYHLSSSPRETA